MRCEVCGAELTATKTDLPFKVRESGIVVLKGLPVLHCTNCPQDLLEDAGLPRARRFLGAGGGGVGLGPSRWVAGAQGDLTRNHRREGPGRASRSAGPFGGTVGM